VVTSGIALAVAAAALIGFDAFDVTGSGLWFVDAPYAFAFVLGYMEIGVAVVCRARRIAVSDDRVERAADVWEVHTDADFIVPEQLPVSPDPAQADVLGIGDIPRALDRLNWNAFLWGAFWALAYGIYAWFWALFAVRTASVVFFTLVNRMNPTPSGTSMTVMVVAWAVLNLGLSALLGFKANRLLWERRGRSGNTAPPIPVTRYRETQRRWARFGIIFNMAVYGVAFLDGTVSTSDWASAAVFLLAIVAVWLIDRRWTNRPVK